MVVNRPGMADFMKKQRARGPAGKLFFRNTGFEKIALQNEKLYKMQNPTPSPEPEEKKGRKKPVKRARGKKKKDQDEFEDKKVDEEVGRKPGYEVSRPAETVKGGRRAGEKVDGPVEDEDEMRERVDSMGPTAVFDDLFGEEMEVGENEAAEETIPSHGMVSRGTENAFDGPEAVDGAEIFDDTAYDPNDSFWPMYGATTPHTTKFLGMARVPAADAEKVYKELRDHFDSIYGGAERIRMSEENIHGHREEWVDIGAEFFNVELAQDVLGEIDGMVVEGKRLQAMFAIPW